MADLEGARADVLLIAPSELTELCDQDKPSPLLVVVAASVSVAPLVVWGNTQSLTPVPGDARYLFCLTSNLLGRACARSCSSQPSCPKL